MWRFDGGWREFFGQLCYLKLTSGNALVELLGFDDGVGLAGWCYRPSTKILWRMIQSGAEFTASAKVIGRWGLVIPFTALRVEGGVVRPRFPVEVPVDVLVDSFLEYGKRVGVKYVVVARPTRSSFTVDARELGLDRVFVEGGFTPVFRYDKMGHLVGVYVGRVV